MRAKPKSAGRKGRRRAGRWSLKWRVIALAAVVCAGAWWWSAGSSRNEAERTSLGRVALNDLGLRAERGDVPAQMELAQRYCSGKGVGRNAFQCAEWYRRAANLGNGVAMLRLGDLYASGEGFILDKDAAALWWGKAAATADGAAGAKSRLNSQAKTP